jgi:hypothetical protein
MAVSMTVRIQDSLSIVSMICFPPATADVPCNSSQNFVMGREPSPRRERRKGFRSEKLRGKETREIGKDARRGWREGCGGGWRDY